MTIKGSRNTSDAEIGSLWINFSQNTGFHAFNKLTPGRNYKLRCMVWTVAVLGMTGYMVYNITRELINYYTHPTVTNVHVQLVEELSFPAVTICNQSPYSLAKVSQLGPEVVTYFKKTSFIGAFVDEIDWNREFQSDIFYRSLERDMIYNVSMSGEDMFFMCFFAGRGYAPCPMTRVLTVHGTCYTFNHNVSDVRTVRLTGSDINFVLFARIFHDDYIPSSQLAAGLRVILHDPHVHPDAATSSFLTSPGTSAYSVLSKSTFKYLPPPYMAFGNRTCVDTEAPDFNNSLEFYDTYTYEHCILECQAKKVYEICGCSKPQDHESLQPRCSLRSIHLCLGPNLDKVMSDADKLKSCNCKLPCSFTTHEAKVSTSLYPSSDTFKYMQESEPNLTLEHLRNNNIEIRMYYEKLMVSTTEQVPVYTTESLIGNLGGQMGICLGASVLTLTELGEFIICVFLACFKRITNAGQKPAPQTIAKEEC